MDSSHLIPVRPSRYPWYAIPALSLLVLAIVFAAGLRFSVFHAVYDAHPDRIVSPDTVRYEKPAVALLRTGSMRDGLPVNESQDVHVAPAYPWLIYSVYKLFGQEHKNLVYAQIILSLINIVLLYSLVASIWNGAAAAAAALLFSLAPLQSLYSLILLSETLFVFSVLVIINVAVRLLQRYASKSNLLLAFALGLAFGFSSLVRPLSYYLVFLFLIALFIFSLAPKNRGFLHFGKHALLIFIGFVVLVAPWQIRNKSIAGAYLFTDNPGQIMLYWKAGGMIAYRDNLSPGAVREKIKETTPADFASIAEKNAYENKAGLEIIKSDIPAYVRFSLHGLKAILIGPGLKKFGIFFDGENAGQSNKTTAQTNPAARPLANPLLYLESKTGFKPWYLFTISYCLVYLLSIYFFCMVGSIAYWRRAEHRIVLVFFLALFAYFVLASTGHTAADSRMRIPAMPVVVLLAGVGLTRTFRVAEETTQSFRRA